MPMIDTTTGQFMGLDNTVNQVSRGSVYPASGMSTGAHATPGTGMRSSGATPATTPAAAQTGIAANPFIGMATLLVLLLALMWAGGRIGSSENEDFANLKATFYNVMFVSLVVITGIPVWKVLSLKLVDWGVPGSQHLASWMSGV